MEKTKRGRKPATPEHKAAYQKWQNERVKIANLVKRKPEIDKSCCICGKPGKIMHNRQDPYYISFICDECRKDKNNLIIAIESRRDIRQQLQLTNLNVSNFSDEQVVRIITQYMNEKDTIGEYCNKIGISRHQFNLLVTRYDELLPKIDIQYQVLKHTKTIQRNKCVERKHKLK